MRIKIDLFDEAVSLRLRFCSRWCAPQYSISAAPGEWEARQIAIPKGCHVLSDASKRNKPGASDIIGRAQGNECGPQITKAWEMSK